MIETKLRCPPCLYHANPPWNKDTCPDCPHNSELTSNATISPESYDDKFERMKKRKKDEMTSSIDPDKPLSDAQTDGALFNDDTGWDTRPLRIMKLMEPLPAVEPSRDHIRLAYARSTDASEDNKDIAGKPSTQDGDIPA